MSNFDANSERVSPDHKGIVIEELRHKFHQQKAE